jgi:hypothetical protein
MVAGFKSERRPTSNRNPWPECVGIRRKREKLHGRRQKGLDFWREESVSVFVGERRLERA